MTGQQPVNHRELGLRRISVYAGFRVARAPVADDPPAKSRVGLEIPCKHPASFPNRSWLKTVFSANAGKAGSGPNNRVRAAGACRFSVPVLLALRRCLSPFSAGGPLSIAGQDKKLGDCPQKRVEHGSALPRVPQIIVARC